MAAIPLVLIRMVMHSFRFQMAQMVQVRESCVAIATDKSTTVCMAIGNGHCGVQQFSELWQ